MKLGLISAAALLTFLPGAALAETATYSAVYSPVLDATTRSCEITNTGVRGGGIGGRDSGVNLTGFSNTAVMRTIGKNAGTAESTAGIQFDMVGANIVAIEQPRMTAERGTVNTGGTIKVNLPNARVQIANRDAQNLGFEPSPSAGNTVAQVTFKNGVVSAEGAGMGRSNKVGSIVVGQRRGGNRQIDRDLTALQNDRSSGRRTGTVNFTLTDIDRDTPTTVMQATISCEPMPVVRNELDASQKAGFITAVTGRNQGGGGPELSCEQDPNCG